MKKWLARMRGAVGIGLTWAAAWIGVGSIVSLVSAAVFGAGLGGLVDTMISYALAGFIGGSAFSLVLGIAEGRRRFDQMSLPRFAAWGAVGGLVLSSLMMGTGGLANSLGDFVLVGIVVLLGAGSAAGSLALARKADDTELLEAGKDVADIGLTNEEKRELLGT